MGAGADKEVSPYQIGKYYSKHLSAVEEDAIWCIQRDFWPLEGGWFLMIKKLVFQTNQTTR